MAIVVIDWHHNLVYGPFQSKDVAEEWLAEQEIYIGQYEEQEVSIAELRGTTEKLITI